MAAFTQLDAIAAGIALAFVVVVWAMHPSIGAPGSAFNPNPEVELGNQREGDAQ